MENVKVTDHGDIYEHFCSLVGARRRTLPHLGQRTQKCFIRITPNGTVHRGYRDISQRANSSLTQKSTRQWSPRRCEIAQREHLYEKAEEDKQREQEKYEQARRDAIVLQKKKDRAEKMFAALPEYRLPVARSTPN